MRRIVSLALASLLLAACADVMVATGIKEAQPPTTDSAYFSGQMSLLLERLKANASRPARKAAVIPFVNTNGQLSDLGRYLTTKFTEGALTMNQFRSVPQGEVARAMGELKIVNDGSFTAEEMAALGSALGADAVVTGVLADLQKGSDVDLSVKAVQAGTGEMLSAASVTIYRSKQVQTLIQSF